MIDKFFVNGDVFKDGKILPVNVGTKMEESFISE